MFLLSVIQKAIRNIFFKGYEALRDHRGSYLVRSFCLAILYLQKDFLKNLKDISHLMQWYFQEETGGRQIGEEKHSLTKDYYFCKTITMISK